jgi:gas vesicle protein
MKNTTKNFAIGALFVGLAGYVAGLLTAPKSGKETRQDIKEATARGAREAERQLKRLHTELNDVIAEASDKADKLSGKAREEMDVAVHATRVAKEKAREILTAVHEGKADDKELDKAVKEARKASDHLKSFLKKRPA